MSKSKRRTRNNISAMQRYQLSKEFKIINPKHIGSN